MKDYKQNNISFITNQMVLNNIKIIFIIIIICLFLVTCSFNDGTDEFRTIITSYLVNSPDGNTIDNPVQLKLCFDLYGIEGSIAIRLCWDEMLKGIADAKKYVALDLSDCYIGTKERKKSYHIQKFSHYTDNNVPLSIWDHSIINDPKSLAKLITSIILPDEDDLRINQFECINLISITLPASTNFYEDSFAFRECKNLTQINLTGNGNLKTIENGKALVRNNTELLGYPSASGDITIDGITKICYNAFFQCTNLISVSFPVSTEIANGAFSGCTNLTNVNIPIVTNIGNYAFNNCTSLTNVSFPDVTRIGDGAFNNCTNLINITLGIISDDFSYNTFPGNLRTVYFNQPEGSRAGTYTREPGSDNWVKQ